MTNGKSNLRCSSGWNAVSVTTDGRYLCCPVANSDKWNHIGTLKDNNPLDVMGIKVIGGLCNKCDIKDICGGRCLYAN